MVEQQKEIKQKKINVMSLSADDANRKFKFYFESYLFTK